MQQSPALVDVTDLVTAYKDTAICQDAVGTVIGDNGRVVNEHSLPFSSRTGYRIMTSGQRNDTPSATKVKKYTVACWKRKCRE